MRLERHDDYILIENKHIIYMSKELQEILLNEKRDNDQSALSQIEEILKNSENKKLHLVGLSDMHAGYVFPVGSVVACEITENKGHISFSGIGGDINCGVRCLVTNLFYEDIKNDISKLADALYQAIPTVQNARVFLKDKKPLSQKEIKIILREGIKSLDNIKLYHEESILERVEIHKCEVKEETGNFIKMEGNIESNGSIKTDIEGITQKQIGKGIASIGSIGSGNHYLEIQKVDKVYDENSFLKKDQIVVFIHCGSRGLGHEINRNYNENNKEKDLFTEYSADKENIMLNCINAATNYAFVNREIISMIVKKVFKGFYGHSKIETLCDCGHNTIKIEKIENKEYIIHRKGASMVKKEEFMAVGGSMDTFSYILQGEECDKTFNSTCHGSGRVVPRTKANHLFKYEQVMENMEEIELRAETKRGIIEECGLCYKNIANVVDNCVKMKIVKKVSKNKPLIVIKG
ncbi:hypothetical protein EHP00_965 [Ecytonucleospora hepatopenaei]|uniref:3'-phosphate/5'-hydroxy nucleic acid ligase n=1 Tax=Ecytonucleospora hepatopenaei TaxID=646526 RepID=A0A1W0E6N5_9MICR|nr:hypothetical protein EHP00_965 [Ecytonucleospora hepatopenaei]